MAVSCLIVDDNHEFLRAAHDLLEREGISVVGVASTGAQARGLSSLFGPGYVGTAVIVDETPPPVARELTIRGLLTGDDIEPV